MTALSILQEGPFPNHIDPAVRNLSANPLETTAVIMALGVIVYFGARYLEENQGVQGYDEADGEILQNLLLDSMTRDSADKLAIGSALDIARVERENLDPETSIEREKLLRKLDRLS